MNRRRFFLASCGVLASTMLVGCDDDSDSPTVYTREDGSSYVEDCHMEVFSYVPITVGKTVIMNPIYTNRCVERDVLVTEEP